MLMSDWTVQADEASGDDEVCDYRADTDDDIASDAEDDDDYDDVDSDIDARGDVAW